MSQRSGGTITPHDPSLTLGSEHARDVVGALIMGVGVTPPAYPDVIRIEASDKRARDQIWIVSQTKLGLGDSEAEHGVEVTASGEVVDGSWAG